MDLLLAHDKGGPFVEDGPDGDSAAGEVDRTDVEDPTHLDDISANANDLPKKRWAVVAAEGEEGDRLIELVRPLIEKRAEDQENDKDRLCLVVRVPPGMNYKQATEWIENDYPKLYKRHGSRESARPAYLCILGDMDQVSLATQEALSLKGYPGRLACPRDADYEAYVDKVLTWERSPSEQTQPKSVFYTVHDGTAATRLGYQRLVKPCFDDCKKDWIEERKTRFPAHSIEDLGSDDEPDPEELLDLARATHPTVLFSMSHGLGPPRGRPFTPKEARERQGAMHFGREGAIEPKNVKSSRFLPGGMWFYFACFGAGTPSASAYHHWLAHLEKHGMEGLGPLQEVLKGLAKDGGFTSGIAQAALANPDGPLAIVSHVDLAWSYSYEELEVGDDGEISGIGRADNFSDIIEKMVQKERAGVAVLNLQRRINGVSDKINEHYDSCKKQGLDPEGATGSLRKSLGNLWMLRQDLRGYVLLGDPAVRLPLAEEKVRTTADRKKSLFGFAVKSSQPAREPEVDQGRVEEVEEVILELANGDIGAGEAAEKLKISVSMAEDWEKAYREAGRKELASLIGQKDD